MVVSSMIKNGSPKYLTLLVVVYFSTLSSIKLGILLLDIENHHYCGLCFQRRDFHSSFVRTCGDNFQRWFKGRRAQWDDKPVVINVFIDSPMYDPAMKTMVVFTARLYGESVVKTFIIPLVCHPLCCALTNRW